MRGSSDRMKQNKQLISCAKGAPFEEGGSKAIGGLNEAIFGMQQVNL